MLEKAQLDDKYFAAQSQTLPYIPMIGDSCSAIRSALAFMYNPPAGGPDTKARQTAEEAATQLTLGMIPAAAEQADFAHKYGILELQIAHEASLLKPLEDAISRYAGAAPEAVVNQVIDCAVAAAHFDLGALLSLCEVFIIKVGAQYMNQPPMKLMPPSSTLIFAQYFHSVAISDQRFTPRVAIEPVRRFVFEAHLKDPPASQEGSTAMIKCLREQGNAAWKLNEMLNCIKPSLQAVVRKAQQTSI